MPIIETGDRREGKEREDGRIKDRERWRRGDVEVEVDFCAVVALLWKWILLIRYKCR